MATDLGFKPYLLDIGGGYPGNKGTSIDKMADTINQALDEYFNSKLHPAVFLRLRLDLFCAWNRNL